MRPVMLMVKEARWAIASCLVLLPSAGTARAGDVVGTCAETKLVAEDGEALDYFGQDVAIWGNTAAIGAPGDYTSAASGRFFLGSAYVFERDPLEPTIWTETAKLIGSDRRRDDYFGLSVAVWGDTAVIGAPGDGIFAPSPGGVYVFERDRDDATVWNQTARLTVSAAADPYVPDGFGAAVAIAGDTVVIGAYLDSEVGEEAGAAYVFERDPLQRIWTLTAKLTAADPSAYQAFGFPVAIARDTVLIGAKYDNDLGFRSGAAYVFERDPGDPTIWMPTAKLTPADGEPGAQFGRSVAISRDTAVIGAWGYDSGRGAAYVFDREPLDPAAWVQTAKLTATDGEEGDSFGSSVAISRDLAVIGAQDDDGISDRDSGSAYVFERDPVDPLVWAQTAKLTDADADGEDFESFGNSVAIAGATAVIGALGDHDQSGSAYVFLRPGCAANVAPESAR